MLYFSRAYYMRRIANYYNPCCYVAHYNRPCTHYRLRAYVDSGTNKRIRCYPRILADFNRTNNERKCGITMVVCS